MTAVDNAPAHWRRTTIGEVAEVRLGRQRSPKDHAGDGMRPYLRAANVDWYGLRPDDIQQMNFTDGEMAIYALRENDILIVEGSGSATEVGKCALVPKRFVGHAFQNTLIRVRCSDGVDPRWLMFRVNADAELGGFLALARGSGIFHLGSTRTGKWPIAVPPLDEQRAIVEAIERLLSHVAVAHRSCREARRRLSHLLHVSQERALQGRLHTERGSRGDAAAAVAAARGDRDSRDILKGAPPDVDIPDTWLWSSVDELADVQSGAAKSKKLQGAADCVERPYLSVANVQRGHIDVRNVGTMWVKTAKLAAITLQPGDVLFNEGGDKDKLGRGWVWEGQVGDCVHQNHVFRARLRTASVEPRWLSHWGNVFGRWWFYERGSQTTGIASINKTVLRSLPVPVPPLVEQHAILDEIERLSAAGGHLSAALDAVENKALALRRSILKAAFEGGLSGGSVAAHSADELEEALA